MLTDFQFFFTLGLSRDRVMKDPSHLKGVDIPYLVKCKCQETIDNLKEMSLYQ